jgi:hypothetical protein
VKRQPQLWIPRPELDGGTARADGLSITMDTKNTKNTKKTTTFVLLRKPNRRCVLFVVSFVFLVSVVPKKPSARDGGQWLPLEPTSLEQA